MKPNPCRGAGPVLATASVLLLAGCAGQNTLYQWERYQPQVHRYFEGVSRQEQAEAMETDLQRIASSGGLAPPGYHAHLGLLYADLGQDEKMVKALETERTLFPEASRYIDFLLRNGKPGGKASEAPSQPPEVKP